MIVIGQEIRFEQEPGESPETPDVSDELLDQTAKAYSLELNDDERSALRGMLRQVGPVELSEQELRWDIIQANYRQQEGHQVEERHVMLFSILKVMREQLRQQAGQVETK